jgi:Uma2 family endonuclease
MALPVAPIVPMTADEYAALPEDGEIHYELQEGVLVPMASPTPEHQIAINEFITQLGGFLPPALRAVSDVDIDLQITPAHRPGFVRRPDIAVVTRAGIARR